LEDHRARFARQANQLGQEDLLAGGVEIALRRQPVGLDTKTKCLLRQRNIWELLRWSNVGCLNRHPVRNLITPAATILRYRAEEMTTEPLRFPLSSHIVKWD
jgi:hypothetical protein